MSAAGVLELATILARGDAERPEDVRALDLRNSDLESADALQGCSSGLRVALLSSNLLRAWEPGLLLCTRLEKLDLSGNGLTTLPEPEELRPMQHLKFLFLHDNQLASLRPAGNLAALPSVIWITLYGNPLAQHASYRHFLVNSVITLRALDNYIISDEELIEDLKGAPAAPLDPRFKLDPPSTPPRDSSLAPEALLEALGAELRSLNRQHARTSPVLAVQAAFRGVRGRGAALVQKRDLAAVRNMQKHVRGHQGRQQGLAARHHQALQKAHGRIAERGANLMPPRVKLKEVEEYEEALDEVEGAATIYVQDCHLQEVLLTLGDLASELELSNVVSTGTDSFVLRSGERPQFGAPEGAAAFFPEEDLLLRRRPPRGRAPPMRLRLMPTQKQQQEIEASGAFRPHMSREALRAAAREARAWAVSEFDALVPKVYLRRQLHRLTLPAAELVTELLHSIAQRNSISLATAMDGEPVDCIFALRGATLQRQTAVCALQRAWRGFADLRHLHPSLALRLLARRAARRLQRWWRRRLFEERLRMLSLLKRRAASTKTNRLYLPTSLFESLKGPAPLQVSRLWPEHRFTFSFTAAPANEVQSHLEERQRALPLWAAPPLKRAPPLPPVEEPTKADSPEASPPASPTSAPPEPAPPAPAAGEVATAAETPPEPLPEQSPLSLLSAGVKRIMGERTKLGSFVHRDWTCVCFQSTAEAARRVAMLTALGYDPLAARAIHGQVQGRHLEPLLLYSAPEVRRHEAASAVSAAWLAHRVRPALLAARAERRAELEAAQEAERNRQVLANPSLLLQPGDVAVASLAPPPFLESPRLPQLNLQPGQLLQLMYSQAHTLGLRGFPPTVSTARDVEEELHRYRCQSAAQQKQASVAAAEAVAARRLREMETAAASPWEPGPSARTGHKAAARALLQMQRMLQARLAAQSAEEAHRQWAQEQQEEQRQLVAARRSARVQAVHERVEDKQQEAEELVNQGRTEQRHLRLAKQLQSQARAVEMEATASRRYAERERRCSNAARRSFSLQFARQQSAMTKQLHLGELRRREEEQLEEATKNAAAERQTRGMRRQAMAARALARAEARRAGARMHNAEIERQLAARHAQAEEELEVLAMKKKQLREIKEMLTRPMGSLSSPGGSRAGSPSAGRRADAGGGADSRGGVSFDGGADADAPERARAPAPAFVRAPAPAPAPAPAKASQSESAPSGVGWGAMPDIWERGTPTPALMHLEEMRRGEPYDGN